MFWTPVTGDSIAPAGHQQEQQGLLAELSGIKSVADEILIVGCGDSDEEAEQDHDDKLSARMDQLPLVQIRKPLQNVLVKEGEDAEFHVELSASVTGRWLVNGKQVNDGDDDEGRRYHMKHEKTQHSMLIQGALYKHDGAEVLFIAQGIRESAALHIQAPQVSITQIPEEQCRKTLVSGQFLLLECEVSRPEALVRWLRDGQEVLPGDDISIQSEGRKRNLLIACSRPEHSGMYICDAVQDTLTFTVQVSDLPVRIVNTNDDAVHEYLTGEPVVLSCELSRGGALVHWYKDGVEVELNEGLRVESEGVHHRLVIPAARTQDSGEFVCDTGDDSVFYAVKVAAPQVSITQIPEEQCRKTLVSDLPVRIVNTNDDAVHEYLTGEPVVLSCELSRGGTLVHWYKDGVEVELNEGLRVESEGVHHRLVIPAARTQDSGEFVCDTGDDSVFYAVKVAAPQVSITQIPEEQCRKTLVSGQFLLLECEVSRPEALVRWFRDGQEVLPGDDISIQSEGRKRNLLIACSRPEHSGMYICDAVHDTLTFTVQVSDLPVRIVNTNDDAVHEYLTGEPVVLSCELSRGGALVHWYKDGVEVELNEGLRVESEGVHHRLVIPAAKTQDSGEFVCDTGDDSVFYAVKVADPPVRIVNTNDDAVHEYLTEEPVVLSCELSRGSALVHWYKDGVEVELNEGLRVESEGVHHRLVIPAARTQDSGEFVCDTGDDSVFYAVKVADPPVRIVNTNDDAVHEYLTGEPVVLSCELSRGSALVHWYKDGVEVELNEGLRVESEGVHHRLVIPAARTQDSGEFVCDTGRDSVFYAVKVADPAVRIVYPTGDNGKLEFQAFDRIELLCELSRPCTEVRWFKDGLEVDESENLTLASEGAHHRLTILSASVEDSGDYLCDARDDSFSFDVKVTGEGSGEIGENVLLGLGTC
ncbi:obscurin-like protein 1 [Rhinatrema bivittatum]|uniref:obscurin-like protein 1 n=1 Tax=Rhinatrema bivittatum TaxID=194408 RepID=UPI001126FA3B|nr:obscurin-like protein 1 [Rhinatrema bivittatum]